jgi:hypothetical protein
LKTVQELMGHNTIAMTARCAHLAPTHKLRALETSVRPDRFRYKVATNWLPTPGRPRAAENRIAINLLNINKLNQV